MPMAVRDAVMSALGAGDFVWRTKRGPIGRMHEWGCLFRYAMTCGMTRKRRVTVQVEPLVKAWIEAVVGMCTAHSKDEYDAHDAKADELLGPLLSAPVKEVREFYHQLCAAMRKDKRVPFLIYIGFEAWGEVMVKDAPDQAVKRLKNALAAEIADLVEHDVKEQLPKAIARALRWRDPEVLEKVKEVVQMGVKPKLVGRESCLFLEMGRGKNKVMVML